ncbi:Protein WVD2-like 7 [Cardamine amara subsp. amara]|uniref:Protein WVD2-like 7 n=1 Tax=Cardamine amara subsp. amara TaxID=228776 RepID=A0ABD0ZXU4_CARAN
MGESAVLFHSYSFAAPLSRNESHEDNPIHALSQSVSFGRFMTENLEWGKWSSFSHKKYVDEAEKFSQPGSVAQKKAFFEAHYKNIAEAKKAKASNESSDPIQKQEPESVAVLLNTLETLTKDEVKEEESGETELVLSSEELVLSVEKDGENERENAAVLEQEDAEVVADDLQGIHDEMEEKKNHTEDGELLKKSCSVGEKEEERRSVTMNASVVRLSMEKSATLETPDKTMELVFTKKISERPMKKMEKPVRQRFSFLSCLMGNTKPQDQTRKKKKTDKKPNKSFLCLCLKPQMVEETEERTKTQKRKI